ncbi:MAG: GNAT family N-acetyltransferase [Polyangiaceae bacterium]|nr:GNAT family N-acetyltransferase [Polyangiaceae bacterium]
MIPAPPITNMRCRRYRPADRSAALGIFDSNVPESFLVSEREQFLAFIDGNLGPYLVVEDRAGSTIGCGGIAHTGPAVTMCWGIVNRRYHRRGVGRFLLRVRLAMSAVLPGVTEVLMNTSNDAAPFFEREGFQTIKVTPNFYREGLHKHDMRFRLDDRARQVIRNRVEEALEAGHLVEAGIL